jgi:hypothetical protein
VFEIGGGVQIAGDPNHISRRTAWAAPPGGTNVRPSRLKLAAHAALELQADKHPIAMTPTANRRKNWAISQYRSGRLIFGNSRGRRARAGRTSK